MYKLICYFIITIFLQCSREDMYFFNLAICLLKFFFVLQKEHNRPFSIGILDTELEIA